MKKQNRHRCKSGTGLLLENYIFTPDAMEESYYKRHTSSGEEI